MRPRIRLQRLGFRAHRTHLTHPSHPLPPQHLTEGRACSSLAPFHPKLGPVSVAAPVLSLMPIFRSLFLVSLALLLSVSAAAAANPTPPNVVFVDTKAFWRPAEESPNQRGYHWNSNTETDYLIGEAMGEVMPRLLGAREIPRRPLPRRGVPRRPKSHVVRRSERRRYLSPAEGRLRPEGCVPPSQK